MALGYASDFVIRNALFNSVFEEQISQFLDVFNAGTNGAIVLNREGMEGDYGYRRFFDLAEGTGSRRDTTVDTIASDTALSMDQIISVKRNRKFGPYAHTLDSWEKLGTSNDMMNVILAERFAKYQMNDWIDAVVISLKNAIGDDSNIIYDYSATGDLAHTALIQGLQLFGDQAGKLVTWFGHSKPFFDLMDTSLTVSNGNVGPATIFNGTVGTIARPYVMSDDTNFTITATATEYATFGHVKDACVVTISEGNRFVAKTLTGTENLKVRYQGEYAYNIEVKGHAWDVSTGGVNPTDATLGTSGNWDSVVASVKNGPGIYIRTT